MKRYAIIVLVVLSLMISVRQIGAQDGGAPLVLDDQTPAIDVVISLPPDTTGVVAIDMQAVVLRLLDSDGNVVFMSDDGRIKEVELRFAPNARPHTLTVERASGFTSGYVRLRTQFDLSVSDANLAPVNGAQMSIGQQSETRLDVNVPSQSLQISTIPNQPAMIASSFPGTSVTWQLVDRQNVAVATLYAGDVNGVGLVIDGGEYELSMLNATPGQETMAIVRVHEVPDNVMVNLMDNMVSRDTVNCVTTINVSSINLRSGPGTGYSILDYGFRSDEFAVGGISDDGSWVLVGLPNGGSAWMLRSLGVESGVCDALTVYDIPVRNAEQPPVILEQVPGPSVTLEPGSDFDDDDYDDYDDDFDDDHDDHDDDD